MENKITKILDSIILNEADQFTNEGLVFSGFSIPQEISKRNDCFKGWSQTFSMEKATDDIANLSEFNDILNSIDTKALIDIYRNKFQSNTVSEKIMEGLSKNGLISLSDNQHCLTDKGICFLTTYLSLKQVLQKR